MRYGIFSDIHSNYEALESVLRAYSSENIDMFFCAGDVVGYGVDPEPCIRRIRELPVIILAGNHDWAVSGRLDTGFFNPAAREAAAWTREILSPEDTGFLDGLRLVYSDAPLTLVHGTLDDPAAFNYLTDSTVARDTFACLETQVCFVGHTHVAEIYSRDAGGMISGCGTGPVITAPGFSYIVNVGSVGQPRDGDSRAAYCVFDTASGRIQVKRVGYDVAAARRKIIDAGLPEYLGDRLLHGR